MATTNGTITSFTNTPQAKKAYPVATHEHMQQVLARNGALMTSKLEVAHG